MTVDDPGKAEFASWNSYQKFAQEVRRHRRYIYTQEIQAFLDTVLVTARDRDVLMPKGHILYRAQLGVCVTVRTDDDGNEIGEDTTGFCGTRMKPRADRANEGRVNPAGISVLYLASSLQTAISEVRPWIGSEVSVAQFKVLRDLKLIDLSKGHGQSILKEILGQVFGTELDASAKERAVWIQIDNAFSNPLTRSDDSADYVPTQIVSELFRDKGYDGVVYRSKFGEMGYNVALFNINDAEAVNCAPYEVTAIKVEHKEIGNRWFSSSSTIVTAQNVD